VRLVENENFETITRWGKYSTFTKVSRVIHSVVTRRINLDNIEGATTITRQLNTTWAFSTG
jgi:hypothetical protein